MTGSPVAVVSLDVGGTLGRATSAGIAADLAALSPLGPREARRVMRETLHTAPEITDEVVALVAGRLGIRASDFPARRKPPHFALFPEAVEAVRELSGQAVVVTLSNVVCTETSDGEASPLLTPWLTATFPSCRTGFAKPDPRAFEAVADALDTPLSRIIHIGDDWECDVLGAEAAGCSAIWLSHGRPTPGTDTLVEAGGVRIAADLAEAVSHVRDLIHRRHS